MIDVPLHLSVPTVFQNFSISDLLLLQWLQFSISSFHAQHFNSGHSAVYLMWRKLENE